MKQINARLATLTSKRAVAIFAGKSTAKLDAKISKLKSARAVAIFSK